MSNAELLIEEIKTLPANRMAQVLDFVEFIKQKETKSANKCPICSAHRDPVTGEELFNAETIAAFEEGDAMMREEIPAKWYSSIEEMLVDLDSDE